MSKIQISTLHKINTLNDQASQIRAKIAFLEQEITDLKKRNQEEEISYLAKTEEKYAQKQNLKIFGKTQTILEAKEMELKSTLSTQIESLIQDFFNSNGLKDFIQKLIFANQGTGYVLEADPNLATKFGLENYQPAGNGEINLVFGHKKFVLGPDYLAEILREKLLIAAFNQV